MARQDSFCTPANYAECIQKWHCCLSPEQLTVIMAFLLTSLELGEEADAEDVLEQYTSIPLMRDPRELMESLLCLLAYYAEDEREPLDIWKAAQEHGYNSVGPVNLRRLILGALCYEFSSQDQ